MPSFSYPVSLNNLSIMPSYSISPSFHSLVLSSAFNLRCSTLYFDDLVLSWIIWFIDLNSFCRLFIFELGFIFCWMKFQRMSFSLSIFISLLSTFFSILWVNWTSWQDFWKSSWSLTFSFWRRDFTVSWRSWLIFLNCN